MRHSVLFLAFTACNGTGFQPIIQPTTGVTPLTTDPGTTEPTPTDPTSHNTGTTGTTTTTTTTTTFTSPTTNPTTTPTTPTTSTTSTTGSTTWTPTDTASSTTPTSTTTSTTTTWGGSTTDSGTTPTNTGTTDSGTTSSWSTTTTSWGTSTSTSTSTTGPTGVDSIAVLNSGDLLITEVMQNPSAVGDDYGEWFEVKNKRGSAVNLQNLVISDDGSDSFTVNSAVVIPANGYVVFGVNSSQGSNGGASVQFEFSASDMLLANGGDELILTANGTEITRIEWDGGPSWPDPTGASMSLKPSANNDHISSDWCEATSSMSGGDLGTPGFSNDPC